MGIREKILTTKAPKHRPYDQCSHEGFQGTFAAAPFAGVVHRWALP
jgi:hypothetical protein